MKENVFLYQENIASDHIADVPRDLNSIDVCSISVSVQMGIQSFGVILDFELAERFQG